MIHAPIPNTPKLPTATSVQNAGHNALASSVVSTNGITNRVSVSATNAAASPT